MNGNKIYNTIIGFLFPKLCVSCGKIIESEDILCEKCQKTFHRIPDKNRCVFCGMVKPDCDCKNHIYYFTAAVCCCFNEGSAQNVVYRFKLQKKRNYAEIIGEEMMRAFESEYKNIKFDYITYVPNSLKSKFLRGFSQTELLAIYISKRLNIPLYKNIIGCKPFKPSQHKMEYHERFPATSGQYFVRKKVEAENVLLIDDIKTTGATLNICSKVLLLSGAHQVFCLSALGGKSKDIQKEKAHLR